MRKNRHAPFALSRSTSPATRASQTKGVGAPPTHDPGAVMRPLAHKIGNSGVLHKDVWLHRPRPATLGAAPLGPLGHEFKDVGWVPRWDSRWPRCGLQPVGLRELVNAVQSRLPVTPTCKPLWVGCPPPRKQLSIFAEELFSFHQSFRSTAVLQPRPSHRICAFSLLLTHWCETLMCMAAGRGLAQARQESPPN
jgi:hypothetical protein